MIITSISVDEILDEMNIQKKDTLRILIENLSDVKQRLRLIDVQKQIIADTLHSEPLTEISNEMRDYFTELIDKKRQLSYLLNIHALKNNASVIINYESDTIVTVKGSDGSLVNTAHFRKVLAMNNDSLD